MMNMLHSIIPVENSSSTVNRSSQNTQLKSDESGFERLFSYNSVAFLYDKRGKQWKELGEGKTDFAFDKESSSIVVKKGESVFHKVSVSTKVQNHVCTSQSWVFRAVHCTSGSHDVLCLQLPNEPTTFVACYEKHRAKCLEAIEQSKRISYKSANAVGSPSTYTEDSSGLDLSSGFKAMKIHSSASAPSQTGSMRRRLSTVGSDPFLDGHMPGARHETPSIASPTQKSPLRPTVSGSAKTLRASKQVPPSILSFSGVSVKGLAPYNPDKQNQDSIVMHQLPNGEILLSVFDGHGLEGHTVSNHFKRRIPKLLAGSSSFSSPSKTGKAIKDALDKAEKEIVENVHVDTTLSGSTGVVCVLREDLLYLANVGDSRAVFGMTSENTKEGKGSYIAKDATVDHKPDLAEEKKRILEVGGRVYALKFSDGIDGPERVWLSYADLPGLAMSRSLCDTIAKEAGVISSPDLFEVELTKEYRFLVIATDGLWEFMSSQEVVDIVAKYADGGNSDPEAAIRELVSESSRRWRLNEPVIDDTSIIVAFFV